MKAILREKKRKEYYKPKILFVNVDEHGMNDTRIKIVHHKDLNWCMRFRYESWLTAPELRAIADKLDEYNKK